MFDAFAVLAGHHANPVPQGYTLARLAAQAALGAGLGLVLVAGLALLRLTTLSVPVSPYLLAAIGIVLVVIAFALRHRLRAAEGADAEPPTAP
ncbi:MAG: hypothetical protein IT557_07735 [Alphaproteobacteria bacterium]|nr:hypothetical protein [Alphaproteobacteria bacterium]